EKNPKLLVAELVRVEEKLLVGDKKAKVLVRVLILVRVLKGVKLQFIAAFRNAVVSKPKKFLTK
ncbi:hypothetical protein BGZ65_004186, partial [Modicella reniformis]